MEIQDTIFSGIVKLLSSSGFNELVAKYDTDRYCKSMSTSILLKTLLLANLKKLNSLRDIESYTDGFSDELKELGLGRIAKSTLSEALARTNADLFEEFFRSLCSHILKRLPKEEKKQAKQTVLSILVSSTFTVSLKRFPWARYKKSEGALKMHVMLHHQEAISYVEKMVLTEGKVADITAGQTHFLPEPDSIFVADRGYESKLWFKGLTSINRTFVIRVKKGTYYYPKEDMPEKLSDGALADEVVFLNRQDYSNPKSFRFRRIVLPPFPNHKEPLILLTNDFSRTASEIGAIYHTRWQIEVFFKSIKHTLPTMALLGTTENAVKIQLFVAFTVHLLLTYLRALSGNKNQTLLPILRKLRNRLFKRISLLELLQLKRIPPTIKLKPQITQLELCFPP